MIEILPCADRLLCQSCGYPLEFDASSTSVSSNTPLFTISCCQVTGAEKYSNTHYSNYTGFSSKVLPIETSLTCNSFKHFSWTSVLAKESELVSRVSFDFPEVSVSRTCNRSCTLDSNIISTIKVRLLSFLCYCRFCTVSLTFSTFSPVIFSCVTWREFLKVKCKHDSVQ